MNYIHNKLEMWLLSSLQSYNMLLNQQVRSSRNCMIQSTESHNDYMKYHTLMPYVYYCWIFHQVIRYFGYQWNTSWTVFWRSKASLIRRSRNIHVSRNSDTEHSISLHDILLKMYSDVLKRMGNKLEELRWTN